MDLIKKGWFSEINEMWPGQCLSLEVEKVLCEEKSKYQDILILQTKNHGRALILDNIIQCTEHDEFAYQEMITFVPLCAHPNPSKVLIVGGGDGGVAREVSKHPLVQVCTQVEIDDRVIELNKKYLPHMAKGFESPKIHLIVGDGFEFLRNHQEEFDVIITDSSDPIGPAVNLFTEPYFKMLHDSLRPGGIICSQAGSMWLDSDVIKRSFEHCKKYFKVVKYITVSVPTYTSGQIGFIVAGLNENCDLEEPKLKFTDRDLEEHNLRYYNSEIHKASFVLPNFIRNIVRS